MASSKVSVPSWDPPQWTPDPPGFGIPATREMERGGETQETSLTTNALGAFPICLGYTNLATALAPAVHLVHVRAGRADARSAITRPK
jgi:hypothetical protein